MYKLQTKRRALKKRPPFYCFIKGNLQGEWFEYQKGQYNQSMHPFTKKRAHGYYIRLYTQAFCISACWWPAAWYFGQKALMQDGFFSLNSRPYAEIPRRPKAYKATILQFCNAWPTLNWQGHIRSGQGCLSVLLCCFSLRVRPVHVVQAPCRAPKRPLSDSSASSRFDFGIFKEAEWGVLNVHPLTMTQKMPKSDRWRCVSPCQFRVNCLHIKP